jgi:uncharacterized membrane protein
MYGVFKFFHVLGVVLLLGNVTVSAVWKVFANRTGNPVVIEFSQRLVTYTDWTLTLGGVVLVAVGGYGMVWAAGMDLLAGWLLWGQALFLASGLIWLVQLVPIQIDQALMARKLLVHSEVSAEYRLLSRRWIAWGLAATVPLVAATYVMVKKI